MHLYTAFGLGISSSLPLPELLPGSGGADVEIRRARGGRSLGAASSTDDDAATMVSPNEWRLFFGDVGEVTVRDGREIVVTARPRVDARTLRLAVLGPAFGVLLQQRGFLVLHASVVEIGGAAVAFLGDSGQGKSTLAAALHARGHPLVADDFAAVRLDGEGPAVHAGFPQFKLWPDAAKALGRDVRRLPRLDRGWTKRAARIAHGFSSLERLPLAGVVLLDVGDAVALAPVAPHDAFLALVRYTYGITWLHDVSGLAQFRDRREVAARVPVRRLTRPWQLGALDDVVTLIEREFAPHA